MNKPVFRSSQMKNVNSSRTFGATITSFNNAIDYSGKDLTGQDFKGANLTGAAFTTIDFNDIIFSNELKITASLSSRGSPFSEVVPTKISINGGDIVDSITINDIRSGGGGGSGSEIITLRVNEYINEIAYSFDFSFYGYVCNYLEFKTSLGTTIKAGNENSQFIQRLTNIRLRKISGRSGIYVDTLTFILVK